MIIAIGYLYHTHFLRKPKLANGRKKKKKKYSSHYVSLDANLETISSGVGFELVLISF